MLWEIELYDYTATFIVWSTYYLYCVKYLLPLLLNVHSSGIICILSYHRWNQILWQTPINVLQNQLSLFSPKSSSKVPTAGGTPPLYCWWWGTPHLSLLMAQEGRPIPPTAGGVAAPVSRFTQELKSQLSLLTRRQEWRGAWIVNCFEGVEGEGVGGEHEWWIE